MLQTSDCVREHFKTSLATPTTTQHHHASLPLPPHKSPRIKKGNIWLSLWGRERERELVDHENRKKGKKNLSHAVQETIVDAISGVGGGGGQL